MIWVEPYGGIKIGQRKIKLVKKGDDYRVCSCPHKRPVFVPEEADGSDSEDEPQPCACSQDLA